MTRKIGLVLLVVGGLMLTWVGATVTWGDPFTSLYTRHEQRVLSARLTVLDEQWQQVATGEPAVARTTVASRRASTLRLLRVRAVAFERTVRDGGPIGRVVIPRLGVRMVVVEGTSSSDLARGPGHYDASSGHDTDLPGTGGVIAIAGHRTTFLHPFLHIDALRRGDLIELQMPYGRFVYRVTSHAVVDATDWSVLRPRPAETLVLTACHPLRSATHRWVVFARLVQSGGL